MINEILFMNGYGLYVWSSFIFTLSGFFILYLTNKLQLIREQKKFYSKFKNLDCRFLIIDSFGKMEQFFNISDIVFLGGSLIKKGGHNPIEAATANCAIITGSNVFNWQNLYEDMVEKDACIMVNEVKEFETKVINLIENKNLVEKLKRNALTFSNTV